jgi:hypothetical protein
MHIYFFTVHSVTQETILFTEHISALTAHTSTGRWWELNAHLMGQWELLVDAASVASPEAVLQFHPKESPCQDNQCEEPAVVLPPPEPVT